MANAAEVGVRFFGDASSAETAARAVISSQEQVAAAVASANEEIAGAARTAAATVAETAAANVAKAIEERNALVELAAEYGRTARAARAGSQEQVAALDLAMAAHRELGTVAREQAAVQIAAVKEVAAAQRASAGAGVAAGAGRAAGLGAVARREERTLGREARGLASGAGLGGRALSFGSTAFLGGAVVGMEVKESLGVVRDMQQAQAQLQNALRNTGDRSAEAAKQIRESVDATEELGFKGTDTRESLTRLIVATQSASEAAADEARAANIARARHIDLTAATQILSRIEAGRAAGLSRFGIHVTQVTTAEDQLKNAHIKVTDANRAAVIELEKRAKAHDQAATRAAALAKVDTVFANSATANARTATGAQERLGASWEKLQFAIGRGLLPQMTKLSNATADWIDKATKSGSLQRDVAEGAHLLGAAFHYARVAVEAVDKVSGSFVNTLKLIAAWWATGKAIEFANAVRKTVVGAYQGAARAVSAFRRTAVAENAVVAASSEEAGAAVAVAFPWAAIAQVAILATVLIIEHWGTVKKWFGVFWEYLQRTGRAAWAAVVELGKVAVYAVLQYATAAIRGVLEVASHLPFVGHKARQALDAINDYISRWKPDFGNVVDAFGRGGTAAGNAFKNAAEAGIAAASGATATGGVGAATAGSAGRRGTGAGERYAPTSGSALQRGLVSTAQSALGVPYRYGGAPSLASPTDCSGLMVAVFQQHGISLPRTSEEQYAQAPIRNARPLAPGDLVFAEGVHPGHVGLYIGGGRVLEDPHTGDHVKIVALDSFGWNGESARWWAKNAKPVRGGDRPTVPKVAADTSFAADLAAAAALGTAAPKAHGTTVSTLTGIAGSVAAVVKRITDEPGPLDDAERSAIARMHRIVDALTPKSSPAQIARARVELRKIETAVLEHVASIHKVAAQHERDAKKFAATVKVVQDAVATMLAPAGTRGLTEVASSVQTARTALDEAGGTLDSTALRAQTRIRELSDRLANLKPSQGTLRDRIRRQIQTWGEALVSELDRQVAVAGARAQLAANALDRYWRDQDTRVQRTFDAATRAAETSFDATTTAWEASFDAESTAWLDAFDRDTKAALAAMTEGAKTQVDALQILVHSAAGDFLFGGEITQTPAEAALAALNDQGTTTDLQRAVDDAQAALVRANTIGDPELVRQAQRSLDDARLAQQRTDLQKQVDVQRTAAQQQLDDARKALQDRLDAEQQAFEDSRALERSAYEQRRVVLRTAYENERAELRTAYENERADQWTALQDRLGDLRVMLDGHLITWKQYVDDVNALGVPAPGGPPPGPLPDISSITTAYGGGITGPSIFAFKAGGGVFDRATPIIAGEAGTEILVQERWLPPAVAAYLRATLRAHGTSVAAPAVAASSGPAGTLGGGAPGRVVYVNVNVDVAGNVSTERDLALAVRDVLVDVGRSSGGNVFGGYA